MATRVPALIQPVDPRPTRLLLSDPRVAAQLVMYNAKTWAAKKAQEKKLDVTEMSLWSRNGQICHFGIQSFSNTLTSYASPCNSSFQYFNYIYQKLILLVHAPSVPSYKNSLESIFKQFSFWPFSQNNFFTHFSIF